MHLYGALMDKILFLRPRVDRAQLACLFNTTRSRRSRRTVLLTGGGGDGRAAAMGRMNQLIHYDFDIFSLSLFSRSGLSMFIKILLLYVARHIR